MGSSVTDGILTYSSGAFFQGIVKCLEHVFIQTKLILSLEAVS
jgi:hypothetical protein